MSASTKYCVFSHWWIKTFYLWSDNLCVWTCYGWLSRELGVQYIDQASTDMYFLPLPYHRDSDTSNIQDCSKLQRDLVSLFPFFLSFLSRREWYMETSTINTHTNELCGVHNTHEWTMGRTTHMNELVSWCFEPDQLQKITSGLNTNFILSPSYSFHKSVHHKSCFFEPFYIPQALNTRTCIQQGDLFHSMGLHRNQY